MVKNDDRSQLILIAAILIATTILGSVILLNTLHSDADITAHKDSQSVKQTERVTSEVTDNLRTLFFAFDSVSEAGEPLPYISNSNPSLFEENVTKYSRNYTELSTLSGTGVLDVTYDDSASISGAVFRQNGSGNEFPNSASPPIDVDASTPYMYFNISASSVTDSSSVDFEVEQGSGIALDKKSGGALEVTEGSSNIICQWGPSDLPDTIQIEVTNGTGEVRGDGTACGEIEIDDTTPITFENPGDATGQYIISVDSTNSVGASINDPDYRAAFTGIVDPMFDFTYEDPSLRFSVDIRLFGGNS